MGGGLTVPPGLAAEQAGNLGAQATIEVGRENLGGWRRLHSGGIIPAARVTRSPFASALLAPGFPLTQLG